MSHRIDTALAAWVRLDPDAPRAFVIAGGAGGATVRGVLSAGRSGWRLTASALRRRRRILLQIVAVPEPGARGEGMEEFDYEVRLRGLPPGAFRIRVNHIFYSGGELNDVVNRGEWSVEIAPAAEAVAGAETA